MDDVPILAGVTTAAAANGRLRAAATLRSATNRSRSKSVAEVDIVLFPAHRLGDLVDAGALAKIPNAAVSLPSRLRDEAGDQGRRARSGRIPLLTMSFDTWTSCRPIASRLADTDLTGSRCRAAARRLCSSIAAMPSSAKPTTRRRSRQGSRWTAADDLGTARCPRKVLPRPRLERRRQARTGHCAGAWGRRRRCRRHDVSGSGRQPGTASRPLLVPVRFGHDDTADRHRLRSSRLARGWSR